VTVPVSFRGTKLERVERAVAGSEAARLHVVARGKGRIIWCPLPVELSDDEMATAAVYRAALQLATIAPAAGIEVTPATGVLVRPLVFKDAILVVVSNETDREAVVRVRVPGAAQPVRITVPSERARMVLVERKTGRVVGTT